jgi:carboxyl-terminal processing protease
MTDPGAPSNDPVYPQASTSVVSPHDARPPDREPSARPLLLIAGALLLVIAFVGGLALGQSGALDVPGTGSVATPTDGPPVPSTPGAPGSPTTPGSTAVPGTSTPGTATPGTAPSEPVASPPAQVTHPPGTVPTLPPNAPSDFGLFFEAMDVIRREFVGRDQLVDTELTYGAINGVVEALGDTGHTVFLTPELRALEEESQQGTIVGIGALLGERDERPVIVSVVSGGPASRAGLRSGDVILEVDGESVEDLAPEEIAPRVRGDEGTTVVISIFRPQTEETLEFSIVREEIRFPAVDWTMIPGTSTGLLRLIQFSDGAAEELRAARDAAVEAGAQNLVLDLRSNPGGFVDEAVMIASLFLPAGETVYIRELADGQRIPVIVGEGAPLDGRFAEWPQATDLPMAVLIDLGTASSAEIVSGGLQGAGRAELIGETTFGTGTVLREFPLSDGSAIRLAIERWLTPEGELIFDRGITPAIEVIHGPEERALEPDEVEALGPEAIPTMEDAQMRRALELLAGGQ